MRKCTRLSFYLLDPRQSVSIGVDPRQMSFLSESRRLDDALGIRTFLDADERGFEERFTRMEPMLHEKVHPAFFLSA
jgi:hypothetical protein